MEMIADSLLFAATLGAMLYCYVLSSRLRRFCALETGMGGAIAVLSAQVDEMTLALAQAREIAGRSGQNLEGLTLRADALAARLELLVAAMHDIPEARTESEPESEARSGIGPRLMRRRPAMRREAVLT